MAKGNGDGEETRGPTRRVVVKRERVIVLPDVVTEEEQKALLTALAGFSSVKAAKIKPKAAEAWVVVGEFEGHSKTKAIEAYAGKPGTPDAKAGAYKAPNLSAWQGGELYKAPPKPLFERSALED